MDDDLRKTFVSKFEAFEAPVAEGQWDAIKGAIVQKPLRKVVLWRRLSIGLILLLYIATSTWFLSREAYADRDEQGLKEAEKKTESIDNAVKAQSERNAGINTAEDVGEKPQQPVNRPELTNVQQAQDDPKTSQESEAETSIITEPGYRARLRSRMSADLVSLEIPPYESERELGKPGPVPMTISMTDSVTSTSRKVNFRPFLGLNLNYLNLRPNPGDNIYFTEIGSEVDLSLQQWGLSVGYEMTLRLADGLKLRNELNLSLRQHRVSFKYIPDASDSENTESLSVESTFSPLTMGISAGLLFDLGGLTSQKRELDLGLSYESVIDDDLGNEALLEYPGSLINLNMGLTFHPKKMNWGIRVFGYYALNKKYSEKALTMTPYGFGVQFLKDKARN